LRRGRGDLDPRRLMRAGKEGWLNALDPFPAGLGDVEADPGADRQGDRLNRHQPQLPDRLHPQGHAGRLMGAKWIPRRYWFVALTVVAVMATILFFMGRNPICPCGTVHFWTGDVNGRENSQQLADWYVPSHI